MLRLRAITLQDFGPFKGEQRVEFSPKDGVTAVSGNNGLGKTKLLNAVRFALFGHVVGRTDTPQDLSQVANWESTDARGFPEFRVVLEFDHDGIPYRLTRHFRHRGGSQTNEVLLARDGDLLTQSDTTKVLNRILPEQIARFFLFDGELLRQYEELAMDPSRGEDLKRAIERILGIPVLTNSRNDVVTISARVTTALAEAAAANRQTEQLGVSLQAAQTLLNQYRANVRELEGQIEQFEHELTELEERMARSERYRALFAKRDLLQEQAAVQGRSLADAKEALGGGSSLAWLAVIAPRANDLVAQADRDIGILQQRQRDQEFATATHAQRELAIQSGECPTCGQHLSDDLRDHLHRDVEPPTNDDLSDELRRLENRRDLLNLLRDPGPANSIAEIEARVENHEVSLVDLGKELEAINKQVADVPEGELKQLALEFSNVMTMVANTRERNEKALALLAEQETAVKQLKDQLARVGGAASKTLDRKAELLQQLDELFGKAVTHYRERLRGSVEAEATRIFRLLRTQEEYDRLEINEGYGLTIIHRDGNPITDRSAGYEHLVAISLLGALQGCAPIRGPVIMDSPFGRLDPEHKARVIAALPEIADQVLLLVYEDEFDRKAAARALGAKLLAEHELVGITARHTQLRERGEE